MIIKVFWKIKFPFPQDIFWTIWLQFRLPRRKICRTPKRFWSANFEELTVFSESLIFKRPSGDVGFSYDQPDGKMLPKIEFLRSECQIDYIKRFFLQKKFSQKDTMDT